MTKIPVRETIVEAYRYTFGHFGKIIALIWLPQLLITIGGYFALKPYLALLASDPEPAELLQHGGMLMGVYGFCFAVVFLMAWLSVTVMKELLNPTVGNSLTAALHPSAFLKVARSMFALVGLFLIAAIVLGIAVALTLHNMIASNGVIAVWFLVLIYFGIRLGYLIVPVAIAEGKGGLARSWKLTAGNFWRIVAVVLACLVPLALVSELFQIAILGPDQFKGMFGSLDRSPDAAAQQLSNLRAMVERMPLLTGLNFFLAPFQVGLTMVPVAHIYKVLTAPVQTAPVQTEDVPAADAPPPAIDAP